jgi:hypothetical protein
MKLFLAREALEPHLKMAGILMKKEATTGQKVKALLKMAGFYALWYPKQWLLALPFKRFGEMGKLAKHYRYINKTSRRLARTIFHSMVRHGPSLQNRQLLLGRIVDIGTELFYMSATCAFAVSKNDESSTDLADYFCIRSKRKIEELFKGLKSNDDKATCKLAKRILNNEYTWLEEGVIPMDD